LFVEFAQVQNVTDGLIESASALGVFYVFPEVDGFLAVLFLKFALLFPARLL